jgi:pimeloyl-ACP methyl ester carboxylesterase
MRRALRVVSSLSPRLAGQWVNFLWYRTHCVKVRPREQRLLDEAEWITVRLQGRTVQCYSCGNGPAVLLVHGWNGRAAQMMPIAEALAERGFRVVAFDAPAHGKSAGKRTELPIISGVIKQLAEQFGPFSAAVTHSFGGMCLLHAIHQGMSVERIVCIAPPLDVKTLVEQFANLLRLPEKVVDVQKGLLEKRFGENLWSQFSMTGWVKNLGIPGLIIHDEEDSYVRVDDGKLIARTWPNSELLLTAGLGHNRILISRTTLDRLSVFLEPLLA